MTSVHGHERTAALLDRFEGIGLESLVHQSALLTRVDRKYLVPRSVLPRLLDAALGPWTDLADRDDLVAVLPAADRLSCLHRAESWRRLQSDVPASCVAEHFARSVPEWLVDATAPDPFASAVSR